MKRLHILFVTEYYPPHIGGVEVFFYELRKALIKKGHKVDVITSSQVGVPTKEKDEGGVIYRVKVPAKIDRYAFTALALPKVLKIGRKVDIIHCTTYNSIPSAWIASKLWRKTTVLSVHEVLGEDFIEHMNGHALKAGLLRILEWSLLRFKFSHTVAVSKATQNELPRGHKKRSSVIYHGVDELFSPRKDFKSGNVKTFLFFGRTAPQKGLWFLLENLPKLYASKDIQTKLKFRLIVSGSPAERDKIHSFLVKNGISDFVSVEASASRSALPDAIKSADAVIVPSFAEGFGFAAVEASACLVPVLASDAGSLPEVVNGKHLFFKSGNEKDLLRKLRLAVDGKWEHKKVQDFTWAKAANEFEALYTRLLS